MRRRGRLARARRRQGGAFPLRPHAAAAGRDRRASCSRHGARQHLPDAEEGRRPGRPDDHRRPRRADLVPAARGRPLRLRSASAAPPRPARAHLVGGKGRGRRRERGVRDPRRQLPRAGASALGGGLRGPARVRADRPRHRAVLRVPHRRRARRQRHPGGRRCHGRAALRVERDRAHPAPALLQAPFGRATVGLRAPELDRRRPRRRPARLRPQHARGLQDRPGDGRDRVDARRQGQQLPDGARHAVRVGTRRAPPAQRGPHDLRQRGGAEDAPAVARARAAGDARARAPDPRLHAPRQAADPQPGGPAAASERRRVHRLGRHGSLQRARARRAPAVRRPLHRSGERHLSRLPLPVAWPARDAARGHRDSRRRPHDGLRELERRYRRRALARARRAVRPAAVGGRQRPPAGLRDRARRGHRRALRGGRGARRARPRAAGRRRPSAARRTRAARPARPGA